MRIFQRLRHVKKKILKATKNYDSRHASDYSLDAFTSLILKSLSWPPSSVTRSGDLLDFGQVFKAFGNN